jgi:hypothetical protein
MDVQNEWRRLADAAVAEPDDVYDGRDAVQQEAGGGEIADEHVARPQRHPFFWLGNGQAHPLVWRLLFCHLFAMDSTTDVVYGLNGQIERTTQHLISCAADMIALLVCIALLRRALGFDVFAVPSAGDATAEPFVSGGASEEGPSKSRRKRVQLLSQAEMASEDECETDAALEGDDDEEEEEDEDGSSLDDMLHDLSAKMSGRYKALATDEETEEDSRVDISSFGNHSFASNKAEGEASTCYYESGLEGALDGDDEDDEVDDDGPKENGGVQPPSRECETNCQPAFIATDHAGQSGFVSEASALLMASVAAMAPKDADILPDFPSPVCEDADTGDNKIQGEDSAWTPPPLLPFLAKETTSPQERPGHSVASPRSASEASYTSEASSCPSLDSRCSWFREHYGVVYEKALFRMRQRQKLGLFTRNGR